MTGLEHKTVLTISAIIVMILLVGSAFAQSNPIFIRGDSNSDGVIDMEDALMVLDYLSGDVEEVCLDYLDAQDDGLINFDDATYILEYIFSGGPEPPEPFTYAGYDPTTTDHFTCGD